jgi:ATP-dependent DNA ligase
MSWFRTRLSACHRSFDRLKDFLSADSISMPKKAFPEFVPPMMAESAKQPFDSPDWIFEIKLDGYRAITVFDDAGKPHLWSRNGLPLEQKFPAIAFRRAQKTGTLFQSAGFKRD